MDKSESNELSSHASLSEQIDDVVDDLFSELADQIETAEDINSHDSGLTDLNEGEADFNDISIEKETVDSVSPESKKEMTVAVAPVSDQFVRVIRRNIKILNNCAARLIQLEKLFSETPGYGKLFSAIKNLRELIEYQLDSLTRALTDDFRTVEAPPILPVRRWKMRSRGASVSCPWNSLVVAKWKNAPVAFIPEQISYFGDNPTICQKKYGTKTLYPLKNLKKSPLDKLQKRLTGALSSLNESQLRKMKLPILKHPGIFQAFSEPLPKYYLLVLSHGDKGGVVFLDTPGETTQVSQQWPWSRETRSDSIIAGHLKIYGEYLPVVDLEKL